MIQNIESDKSELPVIIVVAYNRPNALKRLLKSILNADYGNHSGILLIISIDGGGNKFVNQVADGIIWKHGEKRIICHDHNLGLRDHIISCGDLTENYESVIVIEDDCSVSTNFYGYAVSAIRFYKNEDYVAGISLYAYKFNENASLPFVPLSDGYSTYFMQVPSSLGQIWTKKHWKEFKKYFKNMPEINQSDKLPENVKKWPASSWKKYFYKYLVTKNLFIVYPVVSLSTNFGDAGTHFPKQTNHLQVSMDDRGPSMPYLFADLETSMNKYDAYLEILPHCLSHYGLQVNKDAILDLFGTKQLELFNGNYVYSIKDCKNSIQSFGINLIPIIKNVINNIEGHIIHYGLKDSFTTVSENARKALLYNNDCFAYNYGFQEGKKIGIRETSSSNSYKIGNYLLRPIIYIKKWWRR